MEKLLEYLSQFGNVLVCKKGYVFTLLMTGKKLTHSEIVSAIQVKVLELMNKEFPLIECMVNDDGFLCMVLKPKV